MASLRHGAAISALTLAVTISVYFSESSFALGQVKEDQNDVWKKVPGITVPIDNLNLKPTEFVAFDLDASKLSEILRRAPLAFTPDARARTVIIPLPLPNGGIGRFRLEESPIIAEKLAKQFPWLKSYSVRGLDDRTATGRFEVTTEGFRGMVLTEAGTFAIDRASHKDPRTYIVYLKSRLPSDPGGFVCNGTRSPEIRTRSVPTPSPTPPLKKHHAVPAAGDSDFRTYRLAVAASSEYVNAIHQSDPTGNPLDQAIIAIHRTINRVNAIYEPELGIHLELIGDETSLIYVNSSNDPYAATPPLSLNEQLDKNQSNIDYAVGWNNYDVGHLLLAHGGGTADKPCACNDWYKAQGVTGRSNPQGDLFDVDYVAHELGHQFGASHSFNGTTQGCRYRNADTAYEPGSGSTIMGYAGGNPPICGAESVQGQSDDYFHAISLHEISSFITDSNPQMGDSCSQKLAGYDLARPVVVGPGDYVIPSRTPFTLTIKEGRDDDGDPLIYNWEEFDLGDPDPPMPGDPNDVKKIRPLFRSRKFSGPSRTFPQLIDLLTLPAPGTYTAETPPGNHRTMVFRVTVFDQRGRYGYDDSEIQVVASRKTRGRGSMDEPVGPFIVTQPSAPASWRRASRHTIRWDVANTYPAPVSCHSVRISLLIKGQQNNPITLAAKVPNSGFVTVRIPRNTPLGDARVKVEASDNIFFNLASADIRIVP